jgi:hypothetical protein
MKRGATRAGLLWAVAGILVLGGSGSALAHEGRPAGKYQLEVGFGEEPAYTGQKNSVQLILHDGSGRPVANLRGGLKIEVIFGDQQMELPLVPNFRVGEFGTPGDYRAWFFPTRPGKYTFHIFGTLGGQQIDESFTSSPTTFSEVSDPTEVEFPVKDPTMAQIASRLDREVPRMNARIDTAIAAQQASAKKAADSAKTVGYLGIGLGALALILAMVALVTARRRVGPGRETAHVPAASAGERS